MSWLTGLHIFRLFELYLTLIFLVSTYLRFRQYQAIVGLVRTFAHRWPRLLQLVSRHYNLFLSWGTIFPLAVSGGLLAAQTIANRWIWPQSDEFTVADLLAVWPALPVLVVTGAAMAGFDAWGACTVGEIDRAQLEKYFDQAEYWLRSWAAPVVRVFTLGRINPRQMVAAEVRTALEGVSRLLNYTLWWVSLQAGLRIAFGLSLWGTYALQPWLRGLVSRGGPGA
jgi:hypothetical protein